MYQRLSDMDQCKRLLVQLLRTYFFDLVLALGQCEEQIFVNSQQQKTRLTSVVKVRYMCVQVSTTTTNQIPPDNKCPY